MYIHMLARLNMHKEAFLTELKSNGDIVASLAKSGVSPAEYTDWYRCDDDFRKEVDSQLSHREISLDNKVREIGQRKLLDLLENGQTVRRIKRRVRYNSDGDIIFTDVTTDSLEAGTPEWAIRLAMQRTPIEDALTVLASESMLPTDTVRAVMGKLANTRSEIISVFSKPQTVDTSTGFAVLEAQASLLGIPVSQLTDEKTL